MNRTLRTILRVILKGNHKSWDQYLPHIEFEYNRVVHKTTKISPFEVVYGFNPLTPLNLIPLPNPSDFIQKEGVSRSEFVKKMHEKVKSQTQHQTERNTKQNNKGKREVNFEEGDWVWLHLRKYRFLKQRKSKLNSCGDGPLEYFKVCDLIPFVGDLEQDEDEEPIDLRLNPSQEGGDEGIPLAKGLITISMDKQI